MTYAMTEKCSKLPDRRTILRSIGAGAGVPIVARRAQKAQASEDSRDLGKSIFVEALIVHKEAKSVSLGHIDQFTNYNIDLDSSSLTFVQASKGVADMFKNNEAVLAGDRFRAIPTGQIKGNVTRELITGANNRLQPLVTTPLTKEYSQPTYTVSEAPGEKIEITLDNESQIVSNGSTVELEATPTDVSLKQVKSTNKEESSTETKRMTVTPTLKVKNHGRMRVHANKIRQNTRR